MSLGWALARASKLATFWVLGLGLGPGLGFAGRG